MATDTVPVNPLSGAALTLICWAAPPETSVIDVGEEDREKSGGGAVMVAATVEV